MTAVPRTYAPGPDERAAALALGRAFQRDPSVEYMLGPEPRIAPVTWLLRQGLRASQAEAGGGATRVVDNADGRISAVAAWIPPDRDPIPSFLRHMRLGGWALPWRAGPAVLPRVLRRDEDAARRYRADLQQPEWVLDLLGVDPDVQGTGLGRVLVTDGLARAAADGVPAYLQTYRIENVAWYRTLGFEVVSDVSHADVPQGWGMRWTPRA